MPSFSQGKKETGYLFVGNFDAFGDGLDELALELERQSRPVVVEISNGLFCVNEWMVVFHLGSEDHLQILRRDLVAAVAAYIFTRI